MGPGKGSAGADSVFWPTAQARKEVFSKENIFLGVRGSAQHPSPYPTMYGRALSQAREQDDLDLSGLSRWQVWTL